MKSEMDYWPIPRRWMTEAISLRYLSRTEESNSATILDQVMNQSLFFFLSFFENDELTFI